MVHISGITEEGIRLALENVNKIFEDNIIFRRFDKSGHKYIVTLKVKNSRAAGSRIGHSGKRINAACWHVYGLFFDELFLLNPAATITQCGEKVTPFNNWTDKNIGSIMQPLMYSHACDCNDNAYLIHKLIVRTGEIKREISRMVE